MLLECGNNISNLIINEHHLMKKHQIYCLEKLYYVYKPRENERNIYKIKNIEKQISLNKPEKRKNFEQKRKPLLEKT